MKKRVIFYLPRGMRYPVDDSQDWRLQKNREVENFAVIDSLGKAYPMVSSSVTSRSSFRLIQETAEK